MIALLKPYLKVTNNEDVLKECYLTDLIPFSPLKGEGTAVGSTAKIQSVINDKGVWVNIRREFAKISLQNEIEAVKPKLIIAQGKEVFEELIHVLMITEEPTLQAIIPINAKKRQYIRKIRWKNIDIVSVPHIGSKRMATFWKNNLEEVSRVFNEILK